MAKGTVWNETLTCQASSWEHNLIKRRSNKELIHHCWDKSTLIKELGPFSIPYRFALLLQTWTWVKSTTDKPNSFIFVEGHDMKLWKMTKIWVSTNVSLEEIHTHTNIHWPWSFSHNRSYPRSKLWMVCSLCNKNVNILHSMEPQMCLATLCNWSSAQQGREGWVCSPQTGSADTDYQNYRKSTLAVTAIPVHVHTHHIHREICMDQREQGKINVDSLFIGISSE